MPNGGLWNWQYTIRVLSKENILQKLHKNAISLYENFYIQSKVVYILALQILLIRNYRTNYKIYRTKTGPD